MRFVLTLGLVFSTANVLFATSPECNNAMLHQPLDKYTAAVLSTKLTDQSRTDFINMQITHDEAVQQPAESAAENFEALELLESKWRELLQGNYQRWFAAMPIMTAPWIDEHVEFRFGFIKSLSKVPASALTTLGALASDWAAYVDEVHVIDDDPSMPLTTISSSPLLQKARVLRVHIAAHRTTTQVYDFMNKLKSASLVKMILVQPTWHTVAAVFNQSQGLPNLVDVELQGFRPERTIFYHLNSQDPTALRFRLQRLAFINVPQGQQPAAFDVLAGITIPHLQNLLIYAADLQWAHIAAMFTAKKVRQSFNLTVNGEAKVYTP